MKKYDNKGIILTVIILISFMGHLITTFSGQGAAIYYLNYLCWTILSLYLILKLRQKFSVTILQLTVICLLGNLIGLIHGELIISNVIQNIHLLYFYILVINISIGVDWSKILNEKNVKYCLVVIILTGVVSSFYAMLNQTEAMFSVFAGNIGEDDSWGYKSFFYQRNVYACWIFFAIVSAKELMDILGEKHRRKLTVCIILFLIQIYCTNSRASLIASIIFLLPSFGDRIKKTNNRNLKIILAVFVTIVVIYSCGLTSWIYKIFTHNGTADDGRFRMFCFGVKYLFSNMGVFLGFGFGSQSPILNNAGFGVGSFHNAYMDIFFEGGILNLSIYIYCFYCICIKVRRSCKNNLRRDVQASLAAIFVYSMFEAGATLFTSNTLAVLSTVLFIILPQYLSSEKYLVNEIVKM